MSGTPIDNDKLSEYAKHVFGMLSGATTAAMIYLGDRLGLFGAIAADGPVSSTSLAEATGFDERWIREWLYQQGAAGVLEVTDDESFSISPEAVAVLVDEEHPAFGMGSFAGLPHMIASVEKLPETFVTGLGYLYDDLGPEMAVALERANLPWFKSFLVPSIIPKLGLVDALTHGVKVADIGCGSGSILLLLAAAFPNSEFHGYDISIHALARAEENVAAAGVSNTMFHNAVADPLPPSGDFALVLTTDVLHDMTNPRGTAFSIRAALADDGVWLISDIKAKDTFAENVEKNPMAALMYGFSMLACLGSATSEPNGEALGTLGFTKSVAAEIARDAGFDGFEEVDFRHPVNAFYVVTP